MKVSVVIPVFNAAPFVEQAVQSALAQPETGEVILVDDGSTDGSLDICRHLAEENTAVRLVANSEAKNRGASVARNIGIKNANCPFIAFLDADDYYLPDRFRRAAELFCARADADGVYDSVGIAYEDEEARLRYDAAEWPTMLGLNEVVAPEVLLETLLASGTGAFCTDGIVVRRELFERSGYFKPELKTGQDTHLWIRFSAVGRLYAGGSDKPVAMARVHAGNRVTGRHRRVQHADIQQVWRDLLLWSQQRMLPPPWRRAMARRYIWAANGRIARSRFLSAVGIGWGSVGFLFRRCPQPWRVVGFARLLSAASGLGLAVERAVDLILPQRSDAKGTTS